MSGGNQTSTQTSGLDPSIAGILSQFAGAAQGAMNMPYKQFNGPRVANLSPVTQQAIGAYGGLMNSGGWNQSGATIDDLMSSNMNPYTDQVVNRATQATRDAFNSATAGTRAAYNTPGNFGSARQGLAQDRQEENLARGLGDATGALYQSGWNNMQNTRANAVGLGNNLASTYSGILGSALNAGNTQTQQEQNVINANYGDWQTANNYPWQQLQNGAGIFGQLQGAAPRTTTTTGPGANPISQGLGTIMLGNYLGQGKNSSGAGVSG